MNKQSKNRIKTNLAVQLLAWQWLNNQESGLEYVPPSEEQAIREYQYVPMFNRAVDSISHYIFKEIEAENARLRKALEQLADNKGAAYWTAKEAQDIARQALNAETNADEH